MLLNNVPVQVDESVAGGTTGNVDVHHYSKCLNMYIGMANGECI